MQKWSLKCFFSLFVIIIPALQRKKSGQIPVVIMLHMIQLSLSQQPMYLQKSCHPGKSNSPWEIKLSPKRQILDVFKI